MSVPNPGQKFCPICATHGRSRSLQVYRTSLEGVAFLCPESECPYLLSENDIAVDYCSSEIKNEPLSLTAVAEDYKKYCAQFLQEVGHEFNDEIPPELRAEYLSDSKVEEVKPTSDDTRETQRLNNVVDLGTPAAAILSNSMEATVADVSQFPADSVLTEQPDVSGGQEMLQSHKVVKSKRGRKRKRRDEMKNAPTVIPNKAMIKKFILKPKQAQDESNKLDAATRPKAVAEESVVQKLRLRDMKRAAENPPKVAERAPIELATPMLVPNVLSKRHGRADDLKVNSLMDFVLFYNQSPQRVEAKNGKKLDTPAQPLPQHSTAGANGTGDSNADTTVKSLSQHNTANANESVDSNADTAAKTLPQHNTANANESVDSNADTTAKTLSQHNTAKGNESGDSKAETTVKTYRGRKKQDSEDLEEAPTSTLPESTSIANCDDKTAKTLHLPTIRVKTFTKTKTSPLSGLTAKTDGLRPANENCGSMAFSRTTVNLDKFQLPVEEVKHRGRPRGNSKKFYSTSAK